MWAEIGSAREVVRLGTVSGAANALGLHRATVTRHIDTLEAKLGGKLFLRHARGYQPTELGRELLHIADTAFDQLEHLSLRAQSTTASLSGVLTVATVDVLTAKIMPYLARFAVSHPDVTLHLSTSQSLARLEYGEAHIAIRVGPKPDDPENVVIPFVSERFGLYGAKTYIERYGQPAEIDDLIGHRFVTVTGAASRAPFRQWLADLIKDPKIAFEATQVTTMHAAILQGIGLGFCMDVAARQSPDLVEIVPPCPAWEIPIWIVTHVDLHRSPKVQALLKEIRSTSE